MTSSSARFGAKRYAITTSFCSFDAESRPIEKPEPAAKAVAQARDLRKHKSNGYVILQSSSSSSSSSIALLHIVSENTYVARSGHGGVARKQQTRNISLKTRTTIGERCAQERGILEVNGQSALFQVWNFVALHTCVVVDSLFGASRLRVLLKKEALLYFVVPSKGLSIWHFLAKE